MWNIHQNHKRLSKSYLLLYTIHGSAAQWEARRTLTCMRVLKGEFPPMRLLLRWIVCILIVSVHSCSQRSDGINPITSKGHTLVIPNQAACSLHLWPLEVSRYFNGNNRPASSGLKKWVIFMTAQNSVFRVR